MKVYTSYYKKIEEHAHCCVPVRISIGKPKYLMYELKEVIPEVYPNWDSLVSPYKNGLISDDEYVELYKAQLQRLNKERILQKLKDLYEEYVKPIVLLCYCGPGKFCHRYILAEWLGIEITELENVLDLYKVA